MNSLRNGYSGVFEVADYESQNKKWRIQYGDQVHEFWCNFDNFALIRLATIIQGFLRSLIMNLKTESQNSKWRIQYESKNFENDRVYFATHSQKTNAFS